MNDSQILVVGAGTMGAGIAYVAASAGYQVELVEPDAAGRERGLARIVKDAARAGDPLVTQRITMLDTIPARSDAAIAIEAVPEQLDLKRAIFEQFERALDPRALIATNTSSLHIGDIAHVVSDRGRVVGLHFFNPPAAMKLVEVVYLDDTTDEALDRALAFVERIGKAGVETSDTPGFIVNRVARPFYLQAMRALEREVASMEELDALARSAGFRMGPFELMDLIGIDVNLAVSESVYAQLGEDRLMPRPIQHQLVAQGRLGRKTGSGFYTYEDGRRTRLELVQPVSDGEKLDEFVAIIGFSDTADELVSALEGRCDRLARIENDDLLDQLDPNVTLVIDVGDGATDRREITVELDKRLDPQCVIFIDGYATDIGALASRVRHPERFVGYGVLGGLAQQSAVEVVDAEATGDDALALAQELFEAAGKAVVLVEDRPGLFLGRVIGSIVNEAMIAVTQGVATADDVDRAMRLGVNYPQGPITWGREIGGARITRILGRLAEEEGGNFAPHRALRMLDAPDDEALAGITAEIAESPVNLLGG